MTAAAITIHICRGGINREETFFIIEIILLLSKDKEHVILSKRLECSINCEYPVAKTPEIISICHSSMYYKHNTFKQAENSSHYRHSEDI